MKIRNINIENDELVIIKIEGDEVSKLILSIRRKGELCRFVELVNEILFAKDK